MYVFECFFLDVECECLAGLVRGGFEGDGFAEYGDDFVQWVHLEDDTVGAHEGCGWFGGGEFHAHVMVGDIAHAAVDDLVLARVDEDVQVDLVAEAGWAFHDGSLRSFLDHFHLVLLTQQPLLEITLDELEDVLLSATFIEMRLYSLLLLGELVDTHLAFTEEGLDALVHLVHHVLQRVVLGHHRKTLIEEGLRVKQQLVHREHLTRSRRVRRHHRQEGLRKGVQELLLSLNELDAHIDTDLVQLLLRFLYDQQQRQYQLKARLLDYLVQPYRDLALQVLLQHLDLL
jgi:hypothetical protein